MNLEQLKMVCLSLTGAAVIEHGQPANIQAYSVGKKKFAYFKTSEPEKWRFSIKVMPERYLELTDQEGIKPARFMSRFHWLTIVNINTIDDEYLKELVEWSYDKALLSLTKKVQREIMAHVPKE